MSLSNLELGCMIYFYASENVDDCHIKSEANPEAQYMLKEALENLSEETKLVVSTIMNLPDEYFSASSRLPRYELVSYMKRRFGWNAKKVQRCCDEIQECLGERI